MNRSKGINRLYLGMILTALAAPYLLGLLFTELTLYQSLALSEFIYMVPVLIYLVCVRGEIVDEIQVRPLAASEFLMLVLFGLLLLPVVTWLNLFSMLFSANHVAGSLSTAGANSFWQNVFYIAVLPAVAEEFMFRGVFYHGFRSAGIRKAALASGLCFGLLHMNINQFIYAFVLGVIFALLVEAVGSVTASMIPHFIINCSTVFSLAVIDQLAEDTPELVETAQTVSRYEILQALGMYTMIALVCGALALCVFIWLAGRSGRRAHLLAALHGADRKKGKEGRVWTFSLALAVVIAAAYMVAAEYVVV